MRLLAPRKHQGHGKPHGRALSGLSVVDPRGPGDGAIDDARAAGGLELGISEQGTTMFAAPRFHALGIRTARLVVPWNAIWDDPGQLASWLGAAGAAGVEPFVAFGHYRADNCPSAPCRLPSVATYEAAVRAFVAAYPNVRLITPWNEANHAAEPTAGRPDRAADYYNAARRACATCTLVAADVIDGPGMLSWLETYRSALDEAPRVWGLHDYYDTTYFRTTGLQAFLHAVSGAVWLTETGGIVELRTRDGQVSLPHDERRARASVSFAFETARAFAGRIGRMYLYQWQAEPNGRFDAGLLSPDGTPRPAFDVVRTQAAALAAADEATSAAASPTDTPTATPAVPGRVTVRASGRADARLRCRATASVRCHGRLWIEDAAFQSGTLVNGRAPGYVLRPRSRAFDVAPGRAQRVRFTVPRRVLAHALEQRLLRLRLMVSSKDEPFALRARYRADAWRP